MSNELKAHTHIDYSLHDLDNMKFYLAADVDALLAKKDAEIAELKAEIKRKEAVGQRWFDRCMEARTENVRLRRALWLSRAERAKEFRYKIGFAISSMNTKYDYSDADKWQVVERKCRAKVKEYK